MFIFLLQLRSILNENDDLNQYSPNYYSQGISKRVTSFSSRKPIRVFFDYTYLYNPDSQTCTYAGQSITWGNKVYQCTVDDLLTPEKISTIVGTYDNLKIYLGKLLNVTQLTTPITLRSWPGYATISHLNVSNSDLHITILGRPYGGVLTRASSGSNQLENIEKRAIQGMVFMNIARASIGIEDENHHPTNFFQLCFHELCHIFGFSSSRFSTWIDRKTLKPYDVFPSTILTWGLKKFFILHTPECHKYATYRFGISTFSVPNQNCPSGVEFDDIGGDSFQDSHPERRIYYGEVMTGNLGGNSIISDLVLAVLYDTGFYEVNYKLAKGLVYGNGMAIDGRPLTKFPVGPPQLSFPSNYMCTPNNLSGVCSFDFKAISACVTSTFDCNSQGDYSHEVFCKSQAFMNPKGYSIRGADTTMDFLLFPTRYQNRICTSTDSSKSFPQEKFGPNSRCFSNNKSKMCLDTRCDHLRLFVIVDGVERECLNEGQVLSFGTFTILCQNPEHICRVNIVEKNFNGNPYIDPIFPTPLPTQSLIPSPSISRSPLPSISRSPLPSISRSPLPSPSISRSPLPSPSISRSPLPSPSISRSPLPSPSISRSPLPSISRSPLPSPSISRSPLPSPSISRSPLPSISRSPSPSISRSPLPSPSISRSPLPSPSISRSPLPSPSISRSPLPSISRSPLPSPSISRSPLPSPSISRSPLPSISRSPLPSISRSPLPSISRSPLPSPSISRSPLPSISRSPLPSPSISRLPSPSISRSPLPSISSSIINNNSNSSKKESRQIMIFGLFTSYPVIFIVVVVFLLSMIFSIFTFCRVSKEPDSESPESLNTSLLYF